MQKAAGLAGKLVGEISRITAHDDTGRRIALDAESGITDGGLAAVVGDNVLHNEIMGILDLDIVCRHLTQSFDIDDALPNDVGAANSAKSVVIFNFCYLLNNMTRGAILIILINAYPHFPQVVAASVMRRSELFP